MSFPPPTVPAAPPDAARIKPGKGWYWVGGLLLAGGILGAIALGVAGVLHLKNSIDDFGRFKVVDGAGAATVTFEKPGTYAIYYESKSKVCQDLAASGGECTKETVNGETEPPGRLDISISNDNGALDIGDAEHTIDYSFGDYSGTEVATVKVDEAGPYSMVVETRRDSEFAIALGKGVVSTVLPWIVGALALAAVGLVLGLVTLIVTGVKRGRRKRAAALAASSVYPAAPPPLVATPVLAGAAVAAAPPPDADTSAFAPPGAPTAWAPPPAPPTEPLSPPIEPLPPTEPLSPPIEPLSPPIERLPPAEPLAPPIEPLAPLLPPAEPSLPPAEPLAPPPGPLAPPAEPFEAPTQPLAAPPPGRPIDAPTEPFGPPTEPFTPLIEPSTDAPTEPLRPPTEPPAEAPQPPTGPPAEAPRPPSEPPTEAPQRPEGQPLPPPPPPKG